MVLFSWASRLVTKWRRVHFGAIDPTGIWTLDSRRCIHAISQSRTILYPVRSSQCLFILFSMADVGSSFSSRMPRVCAWTISNAQLMHIKQTTFFLRLSNLVDVPLLRSRLATSPNKWEREREWKQTCEANEKGFPIFIRCYGIEIIVGDAHTVFSHGRTLRLITLLFLLNSLASVLWNGCRSKQKCGVLCAQGWKPDAGKKKVNSK